MATINLDLNQFKSSGIYTLEYDMSESIVLSTQMIRLVIGFSRKGPFNTPVYLPDKKTAKTIFGDIDPFLERRGSFFHRSIYTALEIGPVFALNLLALNNDLSTGQADTVPYQSLSLSTTELNGTKRSELYSSFYNKERFWKPDTEYFIANVNKASSPNKGKILNFVNLGQTPLSIIVKKSDPVRQFDIAANEWFGAGNVPSYIDEYDLISDYFLDVIILQGNWTNYTELSIHPVYGNYFDKRGIIKNKLKDFLALPEVKTFGTYTGSIIPDLRDGSDINYSIDTMINSTWGSIGLFVGIDKEALEDYDAYNNTIDDDIYSGVDLIGHNIANSQDVLNTSDIDVRTTPDLINFLSYSFGIREDYTFTKKDAFTTSDFSADITNLASETTLKNAHFGNKYGYFDNHLKIEFDSSWGPESAKYVSYNRLMNFLIPGTSLVSGTDSKWLKVEQVYQTMENSKYYLNIICSHPSKKLEMNSFGNSISLSEIDIADFTIGAYDEINKTTTITIKEQTSALIANGLLTNKFILEDRTNKLFYYVNSITANMTEAVVNSYTVILSNLSGELLTASQIKNNFKLYYNTSPITSINTGALSMVLKPDMLKLSTGKLSSYLFNKMSLYVDGNVIQSGDMNGTKYLKFTKKVDTDGIDYYEVEGFSEVVEKYTSTGAYEGLEFNNPVSLTLSGSNFVVTDSGKSTTGTSRKFFESVSIIAGTNNTTNTVFSVTTLNANNISINDYIVSKIPTEESGVFRYKLARIIKKAKKLLTDGTYGVEITLNTPAFIDDSNKIVRFVPINEYAQLYQVFHLDGFKMTDYHMPGTEKSNVYSKVRQLEKILSVLDPINTNLMEVLKSRDMVTFRYIVDTFDGGLGPMTYPKTYITRLAKERQKCLAIMNLPSMSQFAKSTDPRFTTLPTDADPKPILDTYYIAQGGNLELNPSYTFTLPDETNGAKFAGYFGPYIMIRENGRNFAIPPAAHVSNLFVQKHKDGTPFHIVAGPKRGVISEPKMVGMEYDFLDRDRDNLEPLGINPIIKRKNTGYMIYANQMAYQKTRSSFNSLHVRDLLITIEEAIEELLGNYIFEFNNPINRVEIKTKVEAYLDKVRALQGIYTYEVVMDESNNTDEVINQRTAILDIAIEPQMGMQKMINRVHVYGSGGIASIGFNVSV
jgi:hypothetical protein